MRRNEVRANRRLTRAYIKQNPTRIFLVPYSKVKNSTGGWVYQKGLIKIQETIRLIEITGQSGQPEPVATTIDGLERRVELQIMAESTSQMALHDRFKVDGVEYEIAQIWPDNGWEKRAMVVRRG